MSVGKGRLTGSDEIHLRDNVIRYRYGIKLQNI